MLSDFIPRKTYAIAASYGRDEIVSVVAGAVLSPDGSISLSFPRSNPFPLHSEVTLHLDNRTGVEAFDSDLRVHRCSYKGSVIKLDDASAVVAPLEYEVVYSTRILESFKSPVFEYPADPRPEGNLEPSRLKTLKLADEKEHLNKLGVLVSRSEGYPHTTLMAFLSTPEDDIFLISQRGTRKSSNLRRDPRCCFAIDHRSTFLFERAYEWNYTIIKGRACSIPRESPLFAQIQNAFVEKNPWEIGFFSAMDIEMYHISPEEILCPEKLSRS